MTLAEMNEPEFLETLKVKNSSGQEAFTRLVHTTADLLFAFISRRLSSEEDCRLILEEVYFEIHAGLTEFKGHTSLSTWIYAITHQKICRHLSELEKSKLQSELPKNQITPDWVLPGNAMGKLISKASEALSKPINHVYFLCDVEGLSGDDAAHILSIKPEEVRHDLQMARRQIVEWVQDKMAKSQVSK